MRLVKEEERQEKKEEEEVVIVIGVTKENGMTGVRVCVGNLKKKVNKKRSVLLSFSLACLLPFELSP